MPDNITGSIAPVDETQHITGSISRRQIKFGSIGENTNFAPAVHTHQAADITVDASGFTGNLTTDDDTVQKVAAKLDTLKGGLSGFQSVPIIDGVADVAAAVEGGAVSVGLGFFTTDPVEIKLPLASSTEGAEFSLVFVEGAAPSEVTYTMGGSPVTVMDFGSINAAARVGSPFPVYGWRMSPNFDGMSSYQWSRAPMGLPSPDEIGAVADDDPRLNPVEAPTTFQKTEAATITGVIPPGKSRLVRGEPWVGEPWPHAITATVPPATDGRVLTLTVPPGAIDFNVPVCDDVEPEAEDPTAGLVLIAAGDTPSVLGIEWITDRPTQDTPVDVTGPAILVRGDIFISNSHGGSVGGGQLAVTTDLTELDGEAVHGWSVHAVDDDPPALGTIPSNAAPFAPPTESGTVELWSFDALDDIAVGSMSLYGYWSVTYLGRTTTLGLYYTLIRDDEGDITATAVARSVNGAPWEYTLSPYYSSANWVQNAPTDDPDAATWNSLYTGNWSDGLVLRLSPNDASDGYLAAWIDAEREPPEQQVWSLAQIVAFDVTGIFDLTGPTPIPLGYQLAYIAGTPDDGIYEGRTPNPSDMDTWRTAVKLADLPEHGVITAGLGVLTLSHFSMPQEGLFVATRSYDGWRVNDLALLSAADVTVDASGFSGNLTTDDDTVQKVAAKVDTLSAGGYSTAFLLGGM